MIITALHAEVPQEECFTLRVFTLPPSQDEKLKKLVEEHGTDSWKLIASLFPVSI